MKCGVWSVGMKKGFGQLTAEQGRQVKIVTGKLAEDMSKFEQSDI